MTSECLLCSASTSASGEEGEKKEQRGLVELCIEAATARSENVNKWRRQRRTLERLPSHLADAIIRRLLHRRLLFPTLLEVFRHSVEEVNLRGESCVDAEWMAYLGAFRHLHSLNIADCKNINNNALWPLSGLNSLKELDISRCSKITDSGIKHLLSIANLEKLSLSETGLTSDGVMLLTSLTNLHVLDLGGIPVTDKALCSMQVLTQLEYLDLWGSDISNIGAATLIKFLNLSFLNLAWTKVTRLPNLPSISCLNMSNCTIDSIFDGDHIAAAPLLKLIVTGANFVDSDKVLSKLQAHFLTFLDLSFSIIDNWNFLVNMEHLEHLDLRYSQITDILIEKVALSWENLRYLNLSNTLITSRALSVLAGCIPNLRYLILSYTSVDDASLAYISLTTSLRVVDLSHTAIRGFTGAGPEDSDRTLSFGAFQNLVHLKSLNLEDTKLVDGTLRPLSLIKSLECLYLKSDFLTDDSLHALASLQNLRLVSFRGAMLTDNGLLSYVPPRMLSTLDLRGCWLLSSDAILSFCKTHGRIDVRHEHVRDQNVSCSSSPFSATSANLSRHRMVKSPKASISKSSFVDERIKYSTEELLQLEHSFLSSCPPKDLQILPDILRRI
ncbi:hypothetical protein HPP92_023680 [Vanilla planifolia]|uniref:Uncharacterized protein n=1 Tax=Vanilla planifolia TaxID=51239 RepID=A0A835PTM1_VANPL|nr:hypothetical protein HPP92_023680 [Vanilla planifolia]